jgi:hypothetical protein
MSVVTVGSADKVDVEEGNDDFTFLVRGAGRGCRNASISVADARRMLLLDRVRGFQQYLSPLPEYA